METLWRIELLGRLCVRRNEHEIVRFRTHRAAALLAYLAFYASRPHLREELLELFWPGEDMEAARNGLRVALSSLRRQLEPMGDSPDVILLSDRSCIQIAPLHITTDVSEFEASLHQAIHTQSAEEQTRLLLSAVELYHGDLLPGFEDWWVVSERQRLADAYLGALRRLSRLSAQTRDFDRALDFARRAVNVDPTREESHRTVMRLYAALGRPRAVQRQYQELERLLRDELKVAPSQSTRQLVIELCPDSLATTIENRAVTFSPPAGSEPASKTVPPSEDARSLPSSSRLPLPLTPFFGREEEIADLTALLRRASRVESREKDLPLLTPHAPRLVTLTGTGGSGKTRLALEVAERLRTAFRDAVWFISLADLVTPNHLAGTVLNSLSLQQASGLLPLDQLVVFLSDRSALLVLDNFEQLLQTSEGDEARAFLRALLEQAPGVRCLVTSRQRLDMAGEQEFPLLPLPTPGRSGSPDRLNEFPSVQLFVQRAQSIRHTFRLTEQNAEAIASLCHRLEGLPLALELAAAWAQTLTPNQMLARLEHRLDFLVSPQRDLSPRHRALRASLEWSYRLLTPELQHFFVQLSVFRGGWTLDAAESVCAALSSVREEERGKREERTARENGRVESRKSRVERDVNDSGDALTNAQSKIQSPKSKMDSSSPVVNSSLFPLPLTYWTLSGNSRGARWWWRKRLAMRCVIGCWRRCGSSLMSR